MPLASYSLWSVRDTPTGAVR